MTIKCSGELFSLRKPFWAFQIFQIYFIYFNSQCPCKSLQETIALSVFIIVFIFACNVALYLCILQATLCIYMQHIFNPFKLP